MTVIPFAETVNLDHARADLGRALKDADGGELYFESREGESLVFDRGRLMQNQFAASAGFGMRAWTGAETAYAHAEELSNAAIRNAAHSIALSGSGSHNFTPTKSTPEKLYERDQNPVALDTRIALISRIDSEIRALDPRIVNVTISLASSHSDIAILGREGDPLLDSRPMARISVVVTVNENGRRESGHAGQGGRHDFAQLIDDDVWLSLGKEALRIALVNLTAEPAPAGEMDLVLGAGWPGVLFHEAVGHGLEGDFNRRKSSAFSHLLGKDIAAKGVRVIDDGTIAARRGSLHFDDEGTPTAKNVLIDDGRLVGYMQDQQNASLMGAETTGNCRRQGFDHAPMPRMTNTYLDAGKDDPKAILASLDDGIYAVGFGGGQVDIVSGKFVFNCTEAYRVKNGEVLYPVKGATLIGDGATALTKISAIGNDLALDPGVGNCGKDGQWVPVSVGQPTVKMRGITVGGTEFNQS